MTFQPVIPLSGYAGWRFLQRTLDTQVAAFVESPVVARSTTYFRENIAKIRTAEDLVGDRRLLEVALGAFGLDDDIDAKAFIVRVLGDGTIADDALANRLADKRYRTMSEAFGFGDLGARTSLSFFADDIAARYEARQFERAVGDQNGDMRLALSLADGLADVIGQRLSPKSEWFAVMGNSALRSVFETALGFPTGFGALDIDQQNTAFQERAQAVFGTSRLSEISAPEQQDKLIRLYLIRSEAAASASNSAGSIALTLLQSSRISYR